MVLNAYSWLIIWSKCIRMVNSGLQWLIMDDTDFGYTVNLTWIFFMHPMVLFVFVTFFIVHESEMFRRYDG